MNFPDYQFISKDYFIPLDITLPSLSQILPNYPDLPSKEIIPSPVLPNRLDKFYEYTYKAVLTDNLGKYQEILESFFNMMRKQYESEVIGITKEYSKKLKEVLVKDGVLMQGLEYGSFQEDVQSVLYEELKEREKLYLKMVDEVVSRAEKLVFEVFDNYVKANEQALEIFENDFKITYDGYTQLLHNLATAYEQHLQDYERLIRGKEIYRQVFEELANIQRRQYEAIKLELQKHSLKEDSKEAINKYLTTYAEYLEIIEQFNLLWYEWYETVIERYKAQLKKFATDIQRIGAIAELINSNVRVYRSKLDMAKAQLALKDVKIDVSEAQLKKYTALLQAREAQLKKKISQSQLKLSQYEKDIVKKQKELEQYKINLLSILSDYRVKLKDFIINLLQKEKDIVNYIGDELYWRAYYAFQSASPHIQNLYAQAEADRAWASGVVRFYEALANACIQANRACIMSEANITSTIIRSYSG